MKTLFLYILSFVIHTIHTNVIIPYRLNFRGDAIEVNPIFGNSTKSQNIEIKLDKDYTHFFRLAYPAALPDGPILTVFHSGYCTNISTVEDTITLNNETQKMNYSFYIFHYDVFPRSLGFGYKFENNSFSIVHSLKRERYIDRLTFSFIPLRPNIRNEEVGSIYFGALPKEIVSNKYKAQCKVSDEIAWNCKLNEVWIDSYQYKNNYYMKFSTDFISFIPTDFFLFLKRSIFCIGYNLYFSSDSNSIYCDKQYIKKFNRTISFIIDDYNFTFRLRDLFACDTQKQYVCQLMLYNNEKIPNQWIIGNNLWSHYITSFDYEQGQITFYSDTPFEKILHSKIPHNIQFNILLLTIFILIFTNFYLFFIYGLLYNKDSI